MMNKDAFDGDVIKELNITRKNISMYPPNHRQVQGSLKRVYGIINHQLERNGKISLEVVKNTLLLDNHEMDPKNAVYSEFASDLNRLDIAGVTFSLGLGSDELFNFLRILSSNSDDIENCGGLEKALSQHHPMTNIKVHTIDYSKVLFTEEKTIKKKNGVEQTSDKVWQDFIHFLFHNGNNSTERDWTLSDLIGLDVENVAQLINNYKLDVEPAVKYYESVVSECLQKPRADKGLREEKIELLVRLNTLVNGIKPELRQQFLEANLRKCAATDSPARVEKLLGCFPDDLIIDMLKQANKNSTAISPSLMRLIEAISKTRELNPGQPVNPSEHPDLQTENDTTCNKKISALFDSEDYDSYVASDYDETIKHFADCLNAPSDRSGDAFPIQEHIGTLEDDNVEFQIARGLLAIMDENVTREEYRDCLKRVIEAKNSLLQQGRFLFLLEIITTLKRHARESTLPDTRALALKGLKSFHTKSFISMTLTSFRKASGQAAQDGAKFVAELGQAVIPDLVNMYCSTESDEEEKIIFDLLIRIGSKTFLEVRRRLKDTSTPFAKRLVKILCHAQGEDVVQDLKRLKKHKDPGVQEAILEGLIKFKDPEGTAILRKLLQVKKNAVRRSAIALAGMHRVQDVTDDLVSIIRKIPLLKAHFVTNETIITALGRIGDSRAIPILERLAKSRWVLNQKRFNHMREILYDSLSGYPYESILKLVKMGKNASSTAIRKTCMEIEARNVA